MVIKSHFLEDFSSSLGTISYLASSVHPHFHWLNSFATVLIELHWQLFSIGHCTITWRGFTKGVSVGVI